MMLERGIFVTYEAIWQWCRKFGQQYANRIRRRRPANEMASRVEVVIAIDAQVLRFYGSCRL